MASKDPILSTVRLTELPDVATLKVDLDQEKLAAFGLSQGDVNSTLSTAWGGRYVNDFVDRGRVKRVFVQGDAPYRAAPSRHRRMVCPLEHRPDDALLLLRPDRLVNRADDAVALPGHPFVRDSRARRPRATVRATR